MLIINQHMYKKYDMIIHIIHVSIVHEKTPQNPLILSIKKNQAAHLFQMYNRLPEI